MERQERRAIPRFVMGLTASVTDRSTGVTQTAVTRDISSDGAFLITAKPLPIGTAVSLSVEISTHGETASAGRVLSMVDLAGTVIRREYAGMVVQFLPRYRIHGRKNSEDRITG